MKYNPTGHHSPVARLFQAKAGLFIFCFILLLAPTQVAAATTVWQVGPNSAGACSAADPHCATVNAAVLAASSGDTIQISAGTLTETIELSKSLTIVGAGAGTTVLDGGYGAGCDGPAPLKKSVVTVLSGKTVSISDLTLQHGCVIGNGDPILEGGGLDNHGTTTLTRVIVQNNVVKGKMGGGGGISNETATGVLTLQDVILADNTAEESAGLDNDHHATLTNVSIFGNKAVGHGREEGTGGGIENDTLLGAVITMTNVTVYANSAVVAAGGILNDDRGTMHMRHVTVSGNWAPKAGGIWNQATAERLDVLNTIVADNAGGNCSGGMSTLGVNLATDGSCGGTFLVKSPALLGPLAAYGGFAPTLALLPGSPAIGATRECALVPRDTRGLLRSVSTNSSSTSVCDIGAFEFTRVPEIQAAPALPAGTPAAPDVADPVTSTDDSNKAP